MADGNPFAYFITFSCHGSRLHGDVKGSVDRHHNLFETNQLPKNIDRYNNSKNKRKNQRYTLDKARRIAVLDELKKICAYFEWLLMVAHIRSNHVHFIVRSEEKPEIVMRKIKAYLSKRINQEFPSDRNLKKWTRHGSTRYLWFSLLAQGAIDYVLYRQGFPMEWYKIDDLEDIV